LEDYNFFNRQGTCRSPDIVAMCKICVKHQTIEFPKEQSVKIKDKQLNWQEHMMFHAWS